MINKAWLEYHYVTKQMTIVEIANFFNISKTAIMRAIKNHEIITRKGGPRLGFKHSKKSILKMSQAQKGKIKSENHRRKISESRKGNKHWNFGKKSKIHGKRCWFQCPNGQIVSMRSNWEVAYAHYLDQNKIEWLYEPKTFLLSSGQAYTPDFFIVKSNQYVEVKGWMTEQHKNKLDMFVKEFSDNIIIADKKYLQHLKIDLTKNYPGTDRPKITCKNCKQECNRKYKEQKFCGCLCKNRWIATHRGEKNYKNFEYLPKRKYSKNQKGSQNNSVKLTEEQVLQIISLRQTGHTLKYICNKCNTSFGNIGNIMSGRSWSHLTGR